MRKIAIGDIHGCRIALRTIIEAINPQPEDTIITLGDYIDRGADSKSVIEQLMALRERCNLITLMGNHELMLMRAFGGKDDMRSWLHFGGVQTLQSYGFQGVVSHPDDIKNIIPYDHMRFIMDCEAYHEDDKNIFVHANYEWDAPMDKQTEDASFWAHLRKGPIQRAHISGKTVWVGHTPQTTGILRDEGHLVCLDTYCFRTGWLTAAEVNSRKIWRSNEYGALQEPFWPSKPSADETDHSQQT